MDFVGSALLVALLFLVLWLLRPKQAEPREADDDDEALPETVDAP
jgi:hypothetical protein